MMETIFTRTEWLLGKDRVRALQEKSVVVFGCGGVGSFAIEALVRTGIGRIIIVDGDKVTASNINRQLIALPATIGRRKVEAAGERILAIRPDIQLETWDIVYSEEKYPHFLEELQVDFLVDAIDTVSAKLSLIEQCHKLGIPCISSMGAGNKLHPEQLKIADIKNTHTCRLARVMRRELRKRGITNQPVVFSTEKPLVPVRDDDSLSPGSCGFVPSVAGLMMAGYVIRQLAGVE